jgi:phosphatidylinositol alpha-1,6-mannosyltransferase
LVTDAFGGRGGIAQYNRDLLSAAAAVAPALRLEVLPRMAPDTVDHVEPRIRQHAPRAGRLAYAAAALGLVWRRRPAVVFCGHLYMAPLSLLLARLVGARLVVQLHGIEIWSAPSGLRRKALEAADMVLCVSRDTRARLLSAAVVDPSRVLVLPNTVADDYTPGSGQAVRERLELQGRFVLLTVGRLDARERYKGHDRVIEALASLEASREVTYLVAGEGDDRARLQALAQARGVADRVRFLGQVPREELPDLYRAADLFVLPSTGEGFGIVFLEAMACGTPALGLAVGGATDALCDGELGTAASDAGFAAALTKLIDAGQKDREALAARTRERFGRAAFEANVARIAARVPFCREEASS